MGWSLALKITRSRRHGLSLVAAGAAPRHEHSPVAWDYPVWHWARVLGLNSLSGQPYWTGVVDPRRQRLSRNC